MLSASLIQLEYASKQWKSTFSYCVAAGITRFTKRLSRFLARGLLPKKSTSSLARHHGVGKADRSTESDRTGRGAAHHAGPRGTPERHAGGHNHGTRTGARQQRPLGATNPGSAHHNHTTTAKQRQRDRTPRTGSSGSGQATGTAAPRTGASRNQRRRAPLGLEHRGRNKQQAPRGATEAATRTRPWRCSEAEWRTRPGRRGENKKRTGPR